MSPLAQPSASPALGQFFHAFTDLKELVEDWSVKERFSFKIGDKDHEQVIYTRVVPECQWRIRANQTAESDVKIAVLNSEYNCLLADGRKRYSVSSYSHSRYSHSKEQSHFCQTGPFLSTFHLLYLLSCILDLVALEKKKLAI